MSFHEPHTMSLSPISVAVQPLRRVHPKVPDFCCLRARFSLVSARVLGREQYHAAARLGVKVMVPLSDS